MSTARTAGSRPESRAATDHDVPHLLPAQRTTSAKEPLTPVSTPTPTPTPDHRLRWPEALAITLAILLGGAVAAGVFRPMLPWLG